MAAFTRNGSWRYIARVAARAVACFIPAAWVVQRFCGLSSQKGRGKSP